MELISRARNTEDQVIDYIELLLQGTGPDYHYNICEKCVNKDRLIDQIHHDLGKLLTFLKDTRRKNREFAEENAELLRKFWEEAT